MDKIIQILTTIFLRYPVLSLYVVEPTSYDTTNWYYLAGLILTILEMVIIAYIAIKITEHYQLEWLRLVTLAYLLTTFCSAFYCLLSTVDPAQTGNPLYTYNRTKTVSQTKSKTIYENNLGASLSIDDTKIGKDLTHKQIQDIDDNVAWLKLEKDEQDVKVYADTKVDITYPSKDTKDYAKYATYHVDKVTLTTETHTKKWFRATESYRKKVATIHVTAKVDEKVIDTRKELEKLAD